MDLDRTIERLNDTLAIARDLGRRIATDVAYWHGPALGLGRIAGEAVAASCIDGFTRTAEEAFLQAGAGSIGDGSGRRIPADWADGVALEPCEREAHRHATGTLAGMIKDAWSLEATGASAAVVEHTVEQMLRVVMVDARRRARSAVTPLHATAA